MCVLGSVHAQAELLEDELGGEARDRIVLDQQHAAGEDAAAVPLQARRLLKLRQLLDGGYAGSGEPLVQHVTQVHDRDRLVEQIVQPVCRQGGRMLFVLSRAGDQDGLMRGNLVTSAQLLIVMGLH